MRYSVHSILFLFVFWFTALTTSVTSFSYQIPEQCNKKYFWSKAQHALNRVQPSKIKNKNYFLFFNCVLFEKLVFNIIQ